MLYHGTIIGGLDVIKANSKSHTTGKPVAYFTQDRGYALVCCRSQNENFVTMGIREDGRQHYFERFPDQLRTLYKGRCGYIYTPKGSGTLRHTTGHTWESETDVPVGREEKIPDVYEEILAEEQAGRIVIHRYDQIDPAEQKMHVDYIKAHLKDESPEMQKFFTKHFAALWD